MTTLKLGVHEEKYTPLGEVKFQLLSLLKMISDDVKAIIIKNREAGESFAHIARTVGRPVSTVKSFYHKFKKNEGLPPKVKISRQIVSGRMGLALKHLVLNDSRLSLRALERHLRELMPEGTMYYTTNI